MIYGLRRCDHVSDDLMTLYWLWIPERTHAVQTSNSYSRVLHGNAPNSDYILLPLSDVPDRSSLRSASSHRLTAPPVRRSIVGARAFPVSGPTVWNSLPADVASIDSLPVFRRRLFCSAIRIRALLYNYTSLNRRGL
jgi:hypothetical protein